MATRDEVREKSKADEERALAVIDARGESACRFGDIVTALGYTDKDVAARRTNVIDRALQRLRKRGVIVCVRGHWQRGER